MKGDNPETDVILDVRIIQSCYRLKEGEKERLRLCSPQTVIPCCFPFQTIDPSRRCDRLSFLQGTRIYIHTHGQKTTTTRDFNGRPEDGFLETLTHTHTTTKKVNDTWSFCHSSTAKKKKKKKKCCLPPTRRPWHCEQLKRQTKTNARAETFQQEASCLRCKSYSLTRPCAARSTPSCH